jgi:hypothetical protein
MPQSRAVASASRSEQSRVDTKWLRLQNPIVDLVARYGVELRRTGSSFTGRCPFHADGGRPNLVVFPYVIWNQTREGGSSSRRSGLWEGGARGGNPLCE